MTIIHRRDEFRASAIMAKRALAHPQIEVIWNSVVEEVLGEGEVKALRLRDVVTDEESEFPVDGLFVAIGHTPNTGVFEGHLELDNEGYLVTAPGTTRHLGRGCLRRR